MVRRLVADRERLSELGLDLPRAGLVRERAQDDVLSGQLHHGRRGDQLGSSRGHDGLFDLRGDLGGRGALLRPEAQEERAADRRSEDADEKGFGSIHSLIYHS